MTDDYRSALKECHALIGHLTMKMLRRDDRIAELEAALRRCHDDRALLISARQHEVETVRMAPAEELLPDDATTEPVSEKDTTKQVRIINPRAPI